MGMRTSCATGLLAAFLLGGLCAPAQADPVDRQISVSVKHRLRNTANYMLRYSLWNADVGGVEVWSEGDTPGDVRMRIKRGKAFKANLGAVVALEPADFSEQLWLQVDWYHTRTATWMSAGPRTRLSVVPYALHAVTSEGTPGYISGVSAGAGLTGGGTTGDVIVNVNPGFGITTSGDAVGVNTAAIQQRVTGTCGAGSSIRVVNADGSVVCEPDTDTNAATMCPSGTFLNGDGTCDALQVPVTGLCAAGSSIRQINTNGTVVCESDTDSNAATMCLDGYFLNGDGSCDSVASVTEVIGGITNYIQNNFGGGASTLSTTMGTATNRFCALSEVGVWDTDGGSEEARCSVDLVSGVWYLRAYLQNPADDANVECEAYCFTLQ